MRFAARNFESDSAAAKSLLYCLEMTGANNSEAANEIFMSHSFMHSSQCHFPIHLVHNETTRFDSKI
jgi:hypothetical protein